MSEVRLVTGSGEAISILLKPSVRSRRVRIVVQADGLVELRTPPRMLPHAGLRFAQQHIGWIEKTVLHMRTRAAGLAKVIAVNGSREEYVSLRGEALDLVRRHIAALPVAQRAGLTKVRIGNQRSRWGSCSRNGVLCFNYRIVHLPASIQRYIVAHEVAHLTHLHHQATFWQLVALLCPEYLAARRTLRRYRINRT